MEEKISVILVNYNGKAYNDKCIRSILQSTLKDKLQIVVVDNDSTDDSLNDLKAAWERNQQIHIIELDQNYGFSKANNEGIKWSMANGIYRFLLLNNDTEIEPDTIEKMLEIQQSTGGIVVPKVLYADRPDIIWCAGGEFSTIIRKPKQRGLNQTDAGQLDENCQCEFANGCCLLLTKEIVDQIGYLDESFFLYYEDTEYSFRALKNNIPVWYCANAVVYHKVNGSTKGNEKPANAYYITRNWLRCNQMYMSRRGFLGFQVYFLFNRMAWIFIWTVKRKRSMIRAVLRGVQDFKKGRIGTYKGM